MIVSRCATGRGRAVRRVPVALCDPARRVINILPELGKYGFVALWRRFWQGKLVKVGEDSTAFLASARYPLEIAFLFQRIKASHNKVHLGTVPFPASGKKDVGLGKTDGAGLQDR